MNTLASTEREILEKRLARERIDVGKIKDNTFVLDKIREACLIESYFSLYMGKMLELFWYDVEATSAFTIEAFEAYTHYLSLRRYLDVVQYKPIQDEEVVHLRRCDVDHDHDDEIRELVNFGMTEHFAAHFFRDLAELTPEPVLRSMLERFSREEVVHSEYAFDLLAKRIQRDASLRERVVQHAQHFRHIGAYVLPTVSNAKEDNLTAVRTFNDRMEKLLGLRLSDLLFAQDINDD